MTVSIMNDDRRECKCSFFVWIVSSFVHNVQVRFRLYGAFERSSKAYVYWIDPGNGSMIYMYCRGGCHDSGTST